MLVPNGEHESCSETDVEGTDISLTKEVNERISFDFDEYIVVVRGCPDTDRLDLSLFVATHVPKCLFSNKYTVADRCLRLYLLKVRARL